MLWYGVRCATFGLLITYAFSGHLFASGFDRFDQDINLLFDQSKVAFDFNSSFAFPARKFSTVNGAPETVRLGQNTFLPSINLKFEPFEDTAGLVDYRQPFGAEIDYGTTWSQARTVVSRLLRVEEIGLTCSYRVQAAAGYVRLIGGMTYDFATYHEEALRVLPNAISIRPTVDLDGSAIGWRGGFAYEVPTKGIRASIVYYSPLALSVNGTFEQLPLGGNAFLGAVPIRAAAQVPQTVETRFQFPFAPAWQNTVFFKWANWSVWTRVPIIVSVNSGALPAGRELTAYNAFFRDGWTISNTLSHKWSDDLGLALRLSWDRGVSTGWTEHTDTWQGVLGASYTINKHLELNGALGLSLLTAGEIDKRAQGGSYNATFGTGTAVSTRIGFRSRF